VLSAALSAFDKWFGGWLPAPEVVLQGLEIVISLAVITGLFALIFKVLPDAQVAWSDVWIGSVLTALLFTIGKFAIALYLGKSDVGSAYGAAGFLVILLVWVYYSAQILLFGAEFTQVYANKLRSRIVPSDNAVVADPAKAKAPGADSPSAPGHADAAKRDAPTGPAVAVHRASASALQQAATGGEQPPWWFALIVLGVSVTRFSRRWAK
jgi:membrane protein